MPGVFKVRWLFNLDKLSMISTKTITNPAAASARPDKEIHPVVTLDILRDNATHWFVLSVATEMY